FNRTTSPRKVDIKWHDLITYDDITNRRFNPEQNLYHIKNLWTGKDEGVTDKNRTLNIPGYDVVLYRFTPVTNADKR
ncbi:MAG: hypothetical protein K2J10_03940, partial [Muribaculaceae bacterium]|nr:hypothetical protein [Muribaculaceae bacterium]